MLFIFKNYYQEILDRLDSLEDNINYLYQRNKFKLNTIMEKDEIMTTQLEMLEETVREQVEVTASAIALIEGIALKLAEAGTDADKLAALTADLDSSADALAAAVAENTIAEDEVTEVVFEPEDEVVEDVFDDVVPVDTGGSTGGIV